MPGNGLGGEQPFGQSDRFRWGIYGSDDLDYESSFVSLMDESFASYFWNRRQAGIPTRVLDVMAGTHFIRTPGVTGGLAIEIEDKRSDKGRIYDESRNLALVTGKVQEPKTWEQVDEWLKKNGIAGFEIITLRPYGAITDIREDFWTMVLPNMYKRLVRGGMIFCQIPQTNSERLQKILAAIRSYSIVCEYQKGDFTKGRKRLNAIKLLKNDNSPPQPTFIGFYRIRYVWYN